MKNIDKIWNVIKIVLIWVLLLVLIFSLFRYIFSIRPSLEIIDISNSGLEMEILRFFDIFIFIEYGTTIIGTVYTLWAVMRDKRRICNEKKKKEETKE